MTSPVETTQTAEKWRPTLDTFGARLAAIRQRLGWNVKEAAIACGLPPENWRRWEQENIEPRRLVTIAMAISTRTGVDVDWLVYGPTKPGQTTVEYLRRDPLAPRLIGATANVGHGDGRKKAGRDLRVPAQKGRNRSTSTHGKRPVSRVSVA